MAGFVGRQLTQTEAYLYGDDPGPTFTPARPKVAKRSAATEVVVRPFAMPAAVAVEPNHILVVRLPDDAKSGYQSLQWREAYMALVKADERGSTSFYVEVGDRRIYPKPGILQTLLFRFDDDAVWKALVSKPLYAIVTVDLNSSKFLRCSFLHRT